MDYRAVITGYRDQIANEYKLKCTIIDDIEEAITTAALVDTGTDRATPAAAALPKGVDQGAAAAAEAGPLPGAPDAGPPPKAARTVAVTTVPAAKDKRTPPEHPIVDLGAAEVTDVVQQNKPGHDQPAADSIPEATAGTTTAPAAEAPATEETTETGPARKKPGRKPSKRTRDRQAARAARQAEIRRMIKAGGPKSLAEIIDPRVAEILMSRGSVTSTEILRIVGEPALSPVMAAWSRKAEALGVKLTELMIRSKTLAGEGVYKVTIEGLDAFFGATEAPQGPTAARPKNSETTA